MHPHGVRYTKADEGALYSDGTSGADKADDAVAPGHTHTYTWQVPERSGPGPADGSSVVWLYHGHTNPVPDAYAGLVGPIVVTARGKARPDGTPRGVDRELFYLYEVSNENESHYLDYNTRHFAKPPYPSPDDEDFDGDELPAEMTRVDGLLPHPVRDLGFGGRQRLQLGHVIAGGEDLVAPEQDHRGHVIAPAQLAGSGHDLPVDLAGHRVGRRPRHKQHGQAGILRAVADHDADELAQWRHPIPPDFRAW